MTRELRRHQRRGAQTSSLLSQRRGFRRRDAGRTGRIVTASPYQPQEFKQMISSERGAGGRPSSEARRDISASTGT